MFAVLCSWTYNLGSGALQRPSLRRLYLNEGRYEEAADELLRWVFCNGRRLRGLVLRRMEEKSCLQIFKCNFGSVGSSRGGSKISLNKPDPIPENPAMFFIALPFTNLNTTLMLSYRFNHFNIFNV